MQHNRHLIIFVKNPVLGRAKTRLAATIGDEKALEVYLRLLEITRNVALGVNCTRHVFYSNTIDNDSWSEDKFKKSVQLGESLGERMKNAFDQVFVLGAREVIIIGSDCPRLNGEIVENGFQLLAESDTCIGPAKDGGYYLLGMNRPLPFLFEDKEWSTDSVFDDTTSDLVKNELTYGQLPELSDLDTADDLYLLDG